MKRLGGKSAEAEAAGAGTGDTEDEAAGAQGVEGGRGGQGEFAHVDAPKGEADVACISPSASAPVSQDGGQR